MSYHKSTAWLPTTKKEVLQRGWDNLDVILFTGDAYVDHPSFGVAVIGRLIEAAGFSVGIVPQPNWQDDLRDFKKLGKPRLFFGVTAGNMDSMVNHYTAGKRLRSNDAYTAGNKSGFRPDYPSIVYSKILKEIYPDIPVVLGGIEASLRRVTHYDYWQDKLKRSILIESQADLLIYGMGEQPLLELLKLLDKGIPFSSLTSIQQTAFLQPLHQELPLKKKWKTLELSSHQECRGDKKVFAKNFRQIERESNKVKSRRLIQQIDEKLLVINPPFPVMKEKELDRSYDLPFTRLPHPKYSKRGPIPAFEMIKFSINLHRGCFGGCSFCTISAHQGKFIVSRSKKSILKEVEQVISMPDFKGNISDLGGPSANMYQMQGVDFAQCEKCARFSCIYPDVCVNLNTSHQALLDIYQAVTDIPEVKKVFIGSGIRYDLLLDDPDEKDPNCHQAYISELVTKHVSGRLKVAPEHTSKTVLEIMRKPSFKLFREFKQKFDQINRQKNLNLQLIPYFISSHPGSRLEDMADLAVKTAELDYRLEQSQDLTPTPMTLSAVIYYTGLHPDTLKPVFTPKSLDEKISQRRFIYWYKKENVQWIKEKLKAMGLDNHIKRLFKLKENQKISGKKKR